MKTCWHYYPTARPEFSQLSQLLEAHASDKGQSAEIDPEKPYLDIIPTSGGEKMNQTQSVDESDITTEDYSGITSTLQMIPSNQAL